MFKDRPRSILLQVFGIRYDLDNPVPHLIADMLSRHNDVEFDRGGLRFTVPVPDEVDFKIELEIGEDERELEIEITW